MATTTKSKSRGDGLQWHETQQQFATDCGQYLSPKTRRAAWKRFYLGSDRATALKIKDYIRTEWKLLKLRGGTLWDDAALRRVAAMRAGVDPTAIELITPTVAAPTNGNETVAVVADGKTLYELFDECERVVQDRARSKQVSGEHALGLRRRLSAARRFIANKPLVQLEYADLLGFAQKLAARPTSERTGRALEIETVKNYRQGLTEALSYAEDSGAWQPRYNWRRALRLKDGAMLTAEELTTVRNVKTFDADTLRMLYNHGTERVRLYMLLCLNCGMGAKEISTLRHFWIHDLDGETPYIERPRNKTRVPGRWLLWSETVTLLRRHLAPQNKKTNPNGYALLGFGGQTLVRICESMSGEMKGKNDEIGRKFNDLRLRVQQRHNLELLPLAFYALRRTGFSWIKENFGTEVAEAWSQHKEQGEITSYSNPVFSKVETAVKAMREKFMPLVFRDQPSPIIHAHLDPIDTSNQ